MTIIQKAKTTAESFSESTSAAGDCEHIKCKLCQY